ncbi:MAG: glycine betaine ABC transporter substrate-binding protein [Polyangiaceae bacterium]
MRRVVLTAVSVGVLVGSATAAAERPVLRIGSKRFTESYILAEAAAGMAERAGDARVLHEQGLGGTALVFRALEEGAIDVYPEYTGTLAEAILHIPGQSDLDTLRRALAPRRIGITDPLGFDNTYGLAVKAKLARERHLATLSDLTTARDLRFGLSPEFLGRSDGFGALAARYRLSTEHVAALDHGLAYEAVAHGSIDVMDVYSTDAKIGRYGLNVLADDGHFFPSYQAVYLYREEAARKAPLALRAIGTLAGAIDARTMMEMNARAELDSRTFESVAEDFLRSREGANAVPAERRRAFASGMMSVVRSEGPRHVTLVGLSLLLATLVGVPLGVVASRAPSIGRVLLGATGIVQTIPALALLCFFIPLLGTGILPALAALFLYGLLPIVANTAAGLGNIPPSLRESASALGLGGWARLFRVELPLASPTILTGIRTSAVISVGGATLAAFVGAGGFGAPISAGLNLDDNSLILEGAIPAAVLALVVEGLFVVLDRALVPRGLRLAGDSRRPARSRSSEDSPGLPRISA